MRAVAKQQRRSWRQSLRATQPSTPASPLRSTGPQGTTGGKAMPPRKPGTAGKQMRMGTEVYLWVLVAVEIALTGGFRKLFRRFHGG